VKIRNLAVSAALALSLSSPAHSTIFSSVRGIVHDPQHRPVKGARVTLGARASDWSQTTETSPEGSFEFAAVPLGEYIITITASELSPVEASLTVVSGSAPILHFTLQLAALKQTVDVTEKAESVATQASATAIMISREQVERTPGADRTNSLSMFTNLVPSASISHNQLHVRGGHMVSWWVDGIPVPN